MSLQLLTAARGQQCRRSGCRSCSCTCCVRVRSQGYLHTLIVALCCGATQPYTAARCLSVSLLVFYTTASCFPIIHSAGTRSGLLVSRSATKGMRVFRMQRDDELLRLMLLGDGRLQAGDILSSKCISRMSPQRLLLNPAAVISRLWQQHVLPGRPPPADVYASWHEHHDMMRRIREVSIIAAGWQAPFVVEKSEQKLNKWLNLCRRPRWTSLSWVGLLSLQPDCLPQVANEAALVVATEDMRHMPGGDSRWFLD